MRSNLPLVTWLKKCQQKQTRKLKTRTIEQYFRDANCIFEAMLAEYSDVEAIVRIVAKNGHSDKSNYRSAAIPLWREAQRRLSSRLKRKERKEISTR